MSEFFGGTDSFENIFGKSIFMVMENLEQVLYLLCHAYYAMVTMAMLTMAMLTMMESLEQVLATRT